MNPVRVLKNLFVDFLLKVSGTWVGSPKDAPWEDQLDFSQNIDDLISEDSLTKTLTDMVNIASPTGEETPLAEYLSGKLISYGIESETQKIDDMQSNAFGKISGQSNEKNLSLIHI